MRSRVDIVSTHTNLEKSSKCEEVTMRTKATIVMFAIVLTAMLYPISALGTTTEAVETKAKLETLVDEYIACCAAKSSFRNSRSEKIRRSAMRSCKKAAYCKRAKAELVEVMLDNNIEPKAYKVRHFLNQKFNGVLQAKE
jgi:hypothetical protein